MRHFHQLRGDDLALEIFGFFESAGLRHGQHPAHLAPALLGISQRGHAGHIESALHHPVDAGQPRIQHAVIHIARHLLRANQHALNIRIVDRGKVGSAIGIDVPARALEQRDGRVLQAAFGNSEAKLVTHEPPPPALQSQWAA